MRAGGFGPEIMPAKLPSVLKALPLPRPSGERPCRFQSPGLTPSCVLIPVHQARKKREGDVGAEWDGIHLILLYVNVTLNNIL